MKRKNTLRNVRHAWAAEWHQVNKLDGLTNYLMAGLTTRLTLFATKKACQEWIRDNYGYIRTRKDLRVEPHCWRVPKAVRVTVTIEKE
jgi:hypothetical protein